MADQAESISFKELGLSEATLLAIEQIGWAKPTRIQAAAIPFALKGFDISGLAETGSGKTAAFTIPIIEAQLKNPLAHSALILTPTLELAKQIKQQLDSLGKSIGISSILLVGGEDFKRQAQLLQGQTHHVIIATPGRFLDHVRKTKGFNEMRLRSIRQLVLDEADKLLDKDFEKALDKLLEILPRERVTFLYSATMTSKVSALQRAGLRADHKRIVISKKKQMVSGLSHYYCLIPEERKPTCLFYLLRDALLLSTSGDQNFLAKLLGRPIRSVIVFVRSKERSNRLALVMNELGIKTEPLNGDMPKPVRLAAMNRFRRTPNTVLIATNVAARGIDIPDVDLVVNYDLSLDLDEYLHRVGRTARGDRTGLAINMISQYSALMLRYLEEEMQFRSENLWTAYSRLMDEEESDSRVSASLGPYGQSIAELNMEKEVAGMLDDINSRMALSIYALKDKRKKREEPQNTRPQQQHQHHHHKQPAMKKRRKN